MKDSLWSKFGAQQSWQGKSLGRSVAGIMLKTSTTRTTHLQSLNQNNLEGLARTNSTLLNSWLKRDITHTNSRNRAISDVLGKHSTQVFI